MLKKFKQWLKPPVFPGDEEKTALARTVNRLGMQFAIALLVSVFILVPIVDSKWVETGAIVLALMIVYGIGRYLMFRGRLPLAVGLVCITTWVAAVVLIMMGGGIFSPMVLALVGATIVTSLFLRPRWAMVFLLATVIGMLMLSILQGYFMELPQYFKYTPLSSWLMFTFSLFFIYEIAYFTNTDLKNSLGNERKSKEELRQVEALLEDSEARFRALSEHSLAGIYIIENGRLTYVNPTFEKIFGYSPGEVIGIDPLILVQPEDHDIVASELRLRASGEKAFSDYEFRGRCKNGTMRYIEALGSTAELGGRLVLIGNLIDITERKKAEEQISSQYNMIKGIVESLEDPLFSVDRDYNYTSFNKSHVAVMKTIFNTDIEIGKNMMDYISVKTERNKIKANIDQALGGKKYVAEDYDGDINSSRRAFEITHTPIRGGDGKVVGAVINARDITERKKWEERLQKSKEQFQDLVETTSDFIWEMDSIGRYIYCSPQMKKLWGYEPEQMIGKTPFDLMRQEDKELAISGFHTVLESASPRIEMEVNSLDSSGRDIALEVRGVPVYDANGRIRGFRGISRDITARKNAEQKISESMNKYKDLAESISDVFFAMDHDLNYTYWNGASEKLTGIVASEAIGKNFFDIFPKNKQNLELAARYQKILENGLPEQFVTTYPGNEHVVHEISAYPSQESISVFVKDVTDHFKLEEERQRIGKLESLGTLAGGIAHDFNNILTGILGNISLAKLKLGTEDEAFNLLGEAERAAFRARDLTQQLLTFARGGTPLKKLINIAGLINEAAVFTLRGSNVKPVFSINKDLKSIEADSGQINQCIHNIVLNAQQAMPTGGTIEISAINTDIPEQSSLPLAAGHYVEITIKDHGIGINKEHLSRIFDPYFTTKQKGNGLGLAITHSIVKNHGGHLAVMSETGAGTTVSVFLPALEKKAAEKEKSFKPNTLSDKGRILVMDDEQMIRDLLEKMLQRIGYQVETSTDGKEAVDKYLKAKNNNRPFDAVILDLTVPGGTGGKEAIDLMLRIDPSVKAIVSSGYANDALMADYRQYGFSAIVSKPYDVQELMAALNKIFMTN